MNQAWKGFFRSVAHGIRPTPKRIAADFWERAETMPTIAEDFGVRVAPGEQRSGSLAVKVRSAKAPRTLRFTIATEDVALDGGIIVARGLDVDSRR